MLELPEASTVAEQIREVLAGRSVLRVQAGASPHKLAGYHGDPQEYAQRLCGRRMDDAVSFGGMVEIRVEEARLLFADGVALRYHPPGTPAPAKHQLLVELEDGSALSASVQMYGGLWCFREGTFDYPYYCIAVDKPSPLSEAFDGAYWERLIGDSSVQKLSAKAFLATEQRIPGLGNGVLQDILYMAGIHPKRKIAALHEEDKNALLASVKSVLRHMAAAGGRDTETDLFGRPGGYETRMSKLTVGRSCPRCGESIRKEAYLGGAVYYCGGCQSL